MKINFNLNLIFVAVIVWCFADQLSAQNVVPDNKLMDLNETMVLPNHDSLLKVIVLDEKEQGEQKNSSTAILDSVNESPKQEWVISIDHVANYPDKHGQDKNEEQGEKEQGDQDRNQLNENMEQTSRTLNKWGKDKGQGVVKKWTWDKEHGLTQVLERLFGRKEQNLQKLQIKKETMKKYLEEKNKEQGLKQNYIIKEWKEQGNENKLNQTEVEPEIPMKSWAEKKPIYENYQKLLEQHEKKAKEQGNETNHLMW